MNVVIILRLWYIDNYLLFTESGPKLTSHNCTEMCINLNPIQLPDAYDMVLIIIK